MKYIPRALLYALCIVIMQSPFTGCRKQDTVKTTRNKPEKVLTAQTVQPGGQTTRLKIIRLYSDTVYILTESFSRNSGEQLIIDPGTIIKIVPGIQINIEPGAFISANGTENDPIIFTSNLPTGSKGTQWNGIRIKGKAGNNNTSGQGEPADNSGSLQFVRIEFGSLVLESVGVGTLIDHIQVSYSGFQPSFRISGGNFNARYLVSYACGGSSDFHITNGYLGKMQFLLAHRHPFFGALAGDPPATLTGMYISNSDVNNTSAVPRTEPIISNLTVLGPDQQPGSAEAYADSGISVQSAAMVTAVNAAFHIRNSVLSGFPLSAWYLVDSNTAFNVNFLKATFTSSTVQSNVSDRVFYIKPRVYRIYDASDFIEYMLTPAFKNRIYSTVSDLQMEDPFNYDDPKVFPKENSTLLNGADFSGPLFSDPFFIKTEFIGAAGRDNWASGWTNFIPLKTYYNPPM